MNAQQTRPGGRYLAAEQGAFEIPEEMPILWRGGKGPTAPLRDFVWTSLVSLDLSRFREWYEGLPEY